MQKGPPWTVSFQVLRPRQKLLCPRAQEAVPFAGAGLSSGVAQVGRWLDTLATGAAGGDEFREVLAGLKKGPKGPSDAAAWKELESFGNQRRGAGR